MKMKLWKRIGTVVLAVMMIAAMGATSFTMADEEGPKFITRIPLKDKYTKECDEKGQLDTITYTTPAYGLDETKEVEKVLQVYTPFGYDPAQKYNVMYIMHGGGESEYYWLNDMPVYEGTKSMGKTTKNVIDNMVQQGLMEPTIFVASTCITNLDGESSGYNDGYALEFRNVIVPLIETTYSTFTEGDVSPENLVATRGHRGFAGFSMGAGCTMAILMNDFDLVGYYGLYSGGSAEMEEFKAAMDSFGDLECLYLYNGNGTADTALEGHDKFAHALLEEMPEKFVEGENWCWVCFKGGSHAYNCWIVDLYNSMLVFFKK